MCEKLEYFTSWSRKTKIDSLTFYFEVAAQESIRKKNNNAKRSLFLNKQSSCGGTSFPAAACRGVGKGKPVHEHLCHLGFRRISPTWRPCSHPRALFVGYSWKKKVLKSSWVTQKQTCENAWINSQSCTCFPCIFWPHLCNGEGFLCTQMSGMQMAAT